MSDITFTDSAIAAALALAQSEMQNAPLNRTNPHFKSKYADLAAIREATLPSLTKHGLSLCQLTHVDERGFFLITRLTHKSGQTIESEYPVPLAVDRPQVMGSALTYARRYSWAAICGIAAEEDDDANAAQEGAKNGSKNAVQKRTRAEISEAADFKRTEAKRVQDDVNQITSFVELERYKREVLTPDFMAKLGNGQWGIEEMFRRREEELMREQDQPARHPTEAEWLEAMQLAATKDELLKIGTDIEAALSPEAVDRLLPAFRDRMKAIKAVHA